MKLHSTKLCQNPMALKGLELLLDVTFFIAPEKHEVLNRLKEHIDTKYQIPKELVSKGSKKSIEIKQQNKDPQHEPIFWISKFLGFKVITNFKAQWRIQLGRKYKDRQPKNAGVIYNAPIFSRIIIHVHLCTISFP